MLEASNSSNKEIIGYVIGAAGLFFGAIQFLLKNRAERNLLETKQAFDQEAAIKEKRFKIYSEFIVKLDHINSAFTASLSSDEFQQEFQTMFEATRSGANPQLAMSQYFRKIAELTSTWGNARTKALEELATLRLVSSAPILEHLDNYTNQTKLLIDELGSLLGKLVDSPNSLLDIHLGDRVKFIHNNLNASIAAIEAQMRLDIGAASNNA